MEENQSGEDPTIGTKVIPTEPNVDMFNKLGADFQKALAAFIDGTDQLGKNALKRVNKALAGHPLENVVILTHPDEIKVYELGKEIQATKLNMMIESLKQDAAEGVTHKEK